MPPAKRVTWNGVEYPSVEAAASALGVGYSAMKKRIAQGYTCDADVGREIPVVWNGVEYPSIIEAAEATGVNYKTLWARVQKGYTCDDDMRPPERVLVAAPQRHGASPRRPRPGRAVTWNGVEYPSVKAAAAATGIPHSTMWNRIALGYTSDDAMPGRAKSVTWRGVRYNSITEAAKACGLTRTGMLYRIRTKRG